MSENYSKADLRCIAESLIDELRECDDGTDITTWQLMESAGYEMDDFSNMDLFEVHDALFIVARANHIKLDMSAHEKMVQGVPYSLDYIVRNKKAQIKCPYCGSKSTARIIYGFPVFDEKMAKKIDEGKLSIGGCCVNTAHVNGKTVFLNPRRVCNNCKEKFGTPSLIINRDDNTAEYYRDLVTGIEYSENGHLEGDTNYTLKRNDKGAAVTVEGFSFEKGPISVKKQITAGRWYRISNRLYSGMYLHEWKKKYIDPDVCVSDGTEWSLKIKLTGGRERNYHGENVYPPYWTEMRKMFKGLAR